MSICLPISAYAARVNETCFVYTPWLAAGYVDFDPFGGRKYRYATRTRLAEIPDEPYEDGTYTIFLSTKGENGSEVPEELEAFLKYVGAELEASEADYESDLVRQFQRSIRKIKADREMRSKYMLFE